MSDHAVLVKDSWLKWFYRMNIWVKNPTGDAEYYLDENDIRMITPELIKNNKIQYHKVSLINLLMLRDVDERLSELELNYEILKIKNSSLEHHLGYILSLIVVLVAFSIFERLRLHPE